MHALFLSITTLHKLNFCIVALELDMGDLCISDFADPDHESTESGQSEEQGIYGGPSLSSHFHEDTDEEVEELGESASSPQSPVEDEEREAVEPIGREEEDNWDFAPTEEDEKAEIEGTSAVKAIMKEVEHKEDEGNDFETEEMLKLQMVADAAGPQELDDEEVALTRSTDGRDHFSGSPPLNSQSRQGQRTMSAAEETRSPQPSTTPLRPAGEGAGINSDDSTEEESVVHETETIFVARIDEAQEGQESEQSAEVSAETPTDDKSVDSVDTALYESRPSGESATPLLLGESTSCSPSVDSLDSPLPVARGGPVVIPQIPSHLRSIRAGSDSPYRDLPPRSTMTIMPFDPCPEQGEIAATAILTTPSSARESNRASSMETPGALRTPSTYGIDNASSAGQHTALLYSQSLDNDQHESGTASQSGILRSPLVSTSQVAGSVDRASAIPQSTRKEQKAAARRQAIHDRLDAAAFNPKLSALGPPQRTVPGSSSGTVTSTSSSRLSHLPGHRLPPSRQGSSSTAQREPSRSASGQSSSSARVIKPEEKVLAAKSTAARIRPSIAGPTFAQPTLASSRAAAIKAGPLAASIKQSTISKPTLIKATTTVPRQPLASRTVTQPTARPSSAFGVPNAPRQIPAKTVPPVYHSAPTRSTMPPPESALSVPNPLKRPYPIAQSTLGKSIAASTIGRPTLGLPSRLVRQGPSGSVPVFSVGVTGPELGVSSLAVSRPGYRSPAVYGHAQRPYGSPRLPERKVS